MSSKIGSYVGNPLFVDSATSDLARVKKIWQLKEQVQIVDLVHEVAVKVPIVEQPEKDNIVDNITEQLVVSPKVVLNVANIFAVLDNDGNCSKEQEENAGQQRKSSRIRKMKEPPPL
ncbi:hypothetical protein LIER_03201 [Lithospermum erythrorhizon]|uniref:Uncharacterized protein n=1 Tax=Lithospermum erythrorhizon TaxID=34254 RepID=A0AAV3NS97_LITER